MTDKQETNHAFARSLSNVGLDVLTDEQLLDLKIAVYTEMQRRKDDFYRADNICPECYGSGYGGSEMDHEPCWRCKTSGKYASNV